jgi:hypothetical protein
MNSSSMPKVMPMLTLLLVELGLGNDDIVLFVLREGICGYIVR